MAINTKKQLLSRLLSRENKVFGKKNCLITSSNSISTFFTKPMAYGRFQKLVVLSKFKHYSMKKQKFGQKKCTKVSELRPKLCRKYSIPK
jgi:hypothetical protein